MLKNILIPTDFKIESLNTLKYCLEERKHEKSSVILMYSAYNSDSITELLFYNPAKIVEGLVSTNFKDAINIIKEASKICNFVGADVVELAPVKTLHSCDFLAAKLCYKILSFALAKPKK